MKKLLLMSAMAVTMMAGLCLTSCGDDDEPSVNGGGATSGKVKVGDISYNVKYGYLIDEEYDSDFQYFEIFCSDTDLSDYLKSGKDFKKTLSFASFYVEKYPKKTKTYYGVYGFHKVYVDTKNEIQECREKNSIFFDYETYGGYPEGGEYTCNVDGDKYSFSGTGLQAEVYKYDISGDYESEEEDLGYSDLSFSVTTTPLDVVDFYDDYYEAPSRSIEIVKVTDPAEKARLRRLFGYKK